MLDSRKEPLETVVEELAGMRTDLQRLVPHLQVALRRAEQDHLDRLQTLELWSRENSSWPLATKIHRMREHLLRTEMDDELKRSICGEMEQILVGFSYRTFGSVGESFDPDCHHAVEGEGVGGLASGKLTIEKVHAQGLAWLEHVVFKTRVSVTSTVLDVTKVQEADDHHG